MGQAIDQGFSDSMLSPAGIVTFLLSWVFPGLLCFGVGMAPCLRPPTSGSWTPSAYSYCPGTLTGSIFVDADQSRGLLRQESTLGLWFPLLPLPLFRYLKSILISLSLEFLDVKMDNASDLQDTELNELPRVRYLALRLTQLKF